jgi:hypothetical protein
MGTSDWISLISAILVGGGTITLAIMTWRSIRQARNIQKREQRERLLNEIIEWAEEIDKASLTPDISLIARNTGDIQLLSTERDANTLMRYGLSRSKATSIVTIVEERFKGALQQHLNDALNELNEFMYVKQMMLYGTLPDEKDFPKIIFKKMTKEIAKGDKSFDQLFEDHAKNLAESIRELIKEATKLKTQDIS